MGLGLLCCGATSSLCAAASRLALLLLWTAMHVLGPGVLVPASSLAMASWWQERRHLPRAAARRRPACSRPAVAAAVEGGAAVGCMLLLPALLARAVDPTAGDGSWR